MNNTTPMQKPYTKTSLNDFCSSNEYKILKNKCESLGLYGFPIEFGKDSPHTDRGLYFVVTPSYRYMYDLQQASYKIPMLVDQQKQAGPDTLNPCYQVFNITDLGDSSEKWNTLMNIIRGINEQAAIVNAFYEFGYYDLPSFIHTSSIYEVLDLDEKRHSNKIPEQIRERYNKDYKKFITFVYQKYKKITPDRLLPQSKSQKVNKNYFIDNAISTTTVRINKEFKEWFIEDIKKHPEFFYYIDNKAALSLKDLSNAYRGEGENIWSNLKGHSEYNMTFPREMEYIYYAKMLEWNMHGYQYEKRMTQVGNPKELLLIRVNWKDMWNWNSLCKANGVKYYINRGDLEPMNEAATQNILIAVNYKDKEMVDSIINRLTSEAIQYDLVDEKLVEKVRKPAQEYNQKNSKNPVLYPELERK